MGEEKRWSDTFPKDICEEVITPYISIRCEQTAIYQESIIYYSQLFKNLNNALYFKIIMQYGQTSVYQFWEVGHNIFPNSHALM